MKPSYKDPRSNVRQQQRDAHVDAGGITGMHRAIGAGSTARGNAYRTPGTVDDPDAGDMAEPPFSPKRHFNEAGPDDFDVSDAPREPMRARRRGPPPVPDRRPRAAGRLPGVPGQPPPLKKGFGTRREGAGDWDQGDAARTPSPEVDFDLTDRQTGKVYRAKGRSPADAKGRLFKSEPDLGDRDPFDFVAVGPGESDPRHGVKSAEPRQRWADLSANGPEDGSWSAHMASPTTMAPLGKQRLAGPRAVTTPMQPAAGQKTQPLGAPTAPDIAVGSGHTAQAVTRDIDRNEPQTTLFRRGAPEPKTRRYDPSLKDVDWNRESVSRPGDQRESSAGGSLAGFQAPIGDHDEPDGIRELREAIRSIISEIVRKVKGEKSKYAVYAPNPKKKKAPKKVGEYPDRVSAQKAELQRGLSKGSAKQLKRKRERIAKLEKDPEKRAKARADDMRDKPKGRSKGAGRSRPKTESVATGDRDPLRAMSLQMSRELSEALFREDDVPGSPWDERLASLNPEHLASDKRLHALHKGVERGSLSALGDGHRAMSKALKRLGRVQPGEPSFDPERRKHFMPCTLCVKGGRGEDGVEIGPFHLYVDGGHVKVEISRDAQKSMGDLDPEVSSDLRGRLVSFQEDELPRIDHALKAVGARDAYLDKLHGRIDGQLGGMSPVEMHLMRQLLRQRRR